MNAIRSEKDRKISINRRRVASTNIGRIMCHLENQTTNVLAGFRGGLVNRMQTVIIDHISPVKLNKYFRLFIGGYWIGHRGTSNAIGALLAE